MQSAIVQFRENVTRVRNLSSLSRTLDVQTTEALELSDLLRAEIALAVSALDYFIHEVVRLGMLDTHRGLRQRTEQFRQFRVSIGSVSEAISDPNGENWLDREIITQHSRLSFQSYENIANAVRLIREGSPWPEVATRMGLEAADIKERLGLIVDRRNKIVHESDMMQPSYLGTRWFIDHPMVEDAVSFIEEVVEAIYATVTQDTQT